ncbi:hypothetical protein [Xanthomonas sp. 3075]|uniref:hypothetical protein n=1 Tax=Xanthomonas sp. 3075 TaxID=3035315 RepID=UPI00161BCA81|nr:hypothetical protein [Xanthomonas sp. 3075]MBB4133305.1 hypothetical protein [Xanthomonas sp. 3075]
MLAHEKLICGGRDRRRSWLGLDAENGSDIEAGPVFGQILRHHRDGTGFWQRGGVDHPFLRKL